MRNLLKFAFSDIGHVIIEGVHLLFPISPLLDIDSRLALRDHFQLRQKDLHFSNGQFDYHFLS